jgi:hypothetical protein
MNGTPQIVLFCHSSTEDSLHTKLSDDIRHVTITVTDTSEDDESASSCGKLIHPDPERNGSPSEEQGNWPLKRSHRYSIYSNSSSTKVVSQYSEYNIA